MFTNLTSSSVIIILFVIFFLIGFSVFFHLFKSKVSLKKNYKFIFSDKIKFIFLVLSFLFLFIAYLGPRGISFEDFDSFSEGRIVFVLDVTKSMNARDYSHSGLNLSRLDVAKKIIDEIILKTPGYSYGLVAFAGDSKKVAPLTMDSGLISILSNGLDFNTVGIEGYNPVLGISTGIELLNSGPGSIVVFTDGGEGAISFDNISGLSEEVDINVYGLGTDNPTPIPDGVSFFGDQLFKTFNGEIVLTSLNEESIKSFTKIGKYEIVDSIEDFKVLEEFINMKNDFFKNSELKRRKNLTRHFVLLSFLAFVAYITILAFEKRKI